MTGQKGPPAPKKFSLVPPETSEGSSWEEYLEGDKAYLGRPQVTPLKARQLVDCVGHQIASGRKWWPTLSIVHGGGVKGVLGTAHDTILTLCSHRASTDCFAKNQSFQAQDLVRMLAIFLCTISSARMCGTTVV